MVVKPHEKVAERSRAVEKAVYTLLDRCDDYRRTVQELLAAEESTTEPRRQLVHRLTQLSGRVDELTRILEGDALTVLVPMIDRLFTLERAERGVDI